MNTLITLTFFRLLDTYSYTYKDPEIDEATISNRNIYDEIYPELKEFTNENETTPFIANKTSQNHKGKNVDIPGDFVSSKNLEPLIPTKIISLKKKLSKKVRPLSSGHKIASGKKLKRRKKKKLESIYNDKSTTVANISSDVDIFGLVEKNDTSLMPSTETSFVTTR